MKDSESNISIRKIANSYLIVASDLLQAAKTLTLAKHIHPRGCSFLTAHALECVLKIFMLKLGYSKKELKDPSVRHNLEVLWTKSFPNSNKVPSWVMMLSVMHSPPYYGRYPEDKDAFQHPEYPLSVTKLEKLTIKARLVVSTMSW